MSFQLNGLRALNMQVLQPPSGTALKSKLLRLAKEKPDEVKVIAINQDGSVFAHVPVTYIKVSPPRQVSDEQKEAASERFKQMWKNRQESEEGENI